VDETSHPSGSRRAGQRGRGLGFVLRCGDVMRAVRAAGEMDDGIDAVEDTAPVGFRADVAERAQYDAGDRFRWASRHPNHMVAAAGELAAQRRADKAGRTSHQDARHAPPPLLRLRWPSPPPPIAQAIPERMD
jgi:hypothetical protein